MNLKDAIQKIERLISEFGKELDDADYIEALEEMETRAYDSRKAREDELEKEES